MAYLSYLYKKLKLFGIWHSGNYFWKVKLTLAVQIYYGIGVISSLIASIRDDNSNIEEVTRTLSYGIAYHHAVLNYFTLFLKRREVVQLFYNLENFDKFGVPKTIKVVQKLINFLDGQIFVYTLIASILTSWFYIWEYEDCSEGGEITNKSKLCGLTSGLTYPYSITSGFMYYIHLLIEKYSFISAACGGCLLFSSSVAALALVIVRIEHLKEKLKDQVSTRGNSEELSKKLRLCVMYHVHIMSLAEETNDCFRLITTPALLTHSICIGTGLLAFQTRFSTFAAVSILGWSVVIFLLCFAGQQLQDKSMSVAEVAYGLNWTAASPKLRRDIQLMILRANRPITFQCGPFGDFNHETYKRIMSAAYTLASIRTGLNRNS